MSTVRYRTDVGWEMRCDDCRHRHIASFWPLTMEFWNPRNLARCRACHRERKNAYERASESKREYLRRYRPACRGAIAIKNAAYYAANRERLLAYERAYRARNRDRILAQQRARYAGRRAA